MTLDGRNEFRGFIPTHALPAFDALRAALAGQLPTCTLEPELWFSDRDPQPAADACRRCRAMTECAAYARTAGEKHGVWGGRDFHRRQRDRGRVESP